MNPGVEAASGNLDLSAHRFDREVITLGMDEGVLYLGSLAKYAAAFL